MDIVLSKSTWPIIGWVCQILGWLINGIYFCLEKIGIPNIGIAIILYTIIIYLVLTPLQIKQQKVFGNLQRIGGFAAEELKRNIRTKKIRLLR